MLSLLQISDLHRSRIDPATNADLVATIVREHDRAVVGGMPPVSAIVVCGDLIQGCGLGEAQYQREIETQYMVAGEFISALTHQLLQGALSRLVMVPGNHDICWNTAHGAMRPAGANEHDNALANLQIASSPYRWDWGTKSLLRIADADRYGDRLTAYRTFFRAFYGGRLPEEISNNTWLYPIDKCMFVAFESCEGTDCYNQAGSISADTIGEVATALRGRRARLRAAVWHHSIDGPPNASDYLDQSCIRKLVYHGFRLGLHGHQHYAAVAPVYIHTDRDEIMAVVSSASLCAGRRELPPGRSRGFNFVLIDEDGRTAQIRSLAMDLEARVQPEYAFNGGSAERRVTWSAALEESTWESDSRELALKAEEARNRGRVADAIALLLPSATLLTEYGRTLLCEMLFEEGRLEELAVHIAGEEREWAPRILAHLITRRRRLDAQGALDRYRSALLPDAVDYFERQLVSLREGHPDGS